MFLLFSSIRIALLVFQLNSEDRSASLHNLYARGKKRKIFKRCLLWNHCANFKPRLYECCLGGPLPKLAHLVRCAAQHKLAATPKGRLVGPISTKYQRAVPCIFLYHYAEIVLPWLTTWLPEVTTERKLIKLYNLLLTASPPKPLHQFNQTSYHSSLIYFLKSFH